MNFNSQKIFTKIAEYFNEYRNDKKTFMDICEVIFEWIKTTNLNQVESMNELKKIIPIQFIAQNSDLNGVEFKWRETECKYQLTFVLSASIDKREQDKFMKYECRKYGLEYTDETQLKLNEEKLLNSGFTIIKTEIDEFFKANPTGNFEKKPY